MTRVIAAVAGSLLLVNCTDSVPEVHEVALSAANLSRHELPDGTSHYSTIAVFLHAAIAKAPHVYLYVEDARFQPDTIVDIYLAPPGSPAIDSRHLIQTISAPRGESGAVPMIAHEVLDFERDGILHSPRTALRELAGVAVALHVKQGKFDAARLVLSNGTKAEREAYAKRAAARAR